VISQPKIVSYAIVISLGPGSVSAWGMAPQTDIRGALGMLSSGQVCVASASADVACWAIDGVKPRVSKAFLREKLKGNFQGAPEYLGG
jgi:hypothetical protein